MESVKQLLIVCLAVLPLHIHGAGQEETKQQTEQKVNAQATKDLATELVCYPIDFQAARAAIDSGADLTAANALQKMIRSYVKNPVVKGAKKTERDTYEFIKYLVKQPAIAGNRDITTPALYMVAATPTQLHSEELTRLLLQLLLKNNADPDMIRNDMHSDRSALQNLRWIVETYPDSPAAPVYLNRIKILERGNLVISPKQAKKESIQAQTALTQEISPAQPALLPSDLAELVGEYVYYDEALTVKPKKAGAGAGASSTKLPLGSAGAAGSKD